MYFNVEVSGDVGMSSVLHEEHGLPFTVPVFGRKKSLGTLDGEVTLFTCSVT